MSDDAQDDRPLLEVRGLCKEFRLRSGAWGARESVMAVQDVSFTVARNSCLGIVGESGSGKTTTARMLMGLVSPTAGEIVFDGQPLDPNPGTRERRARARKMQMVFQHPYASLNPRQNAEEMLTEILSFHQVVAPSERRARVAELLDQVGIDSAMARRPPRSLSGGQCQRIAIARALAAEPELIVLDEAVSALDVSTQAQVLNLLADLRDALGVAMIMISHDLAVTRQLCDAVIVMHDGRAVEQGPVEAVLGDPQDPYTKLLLASVPRGYVADAA